MGPRIPRKIHFNVGGADTNDCQCDRSSVRSSCTLCSLEWRGCGIHGCPCELKSDILIFTLIIDGFLDQHECALVKVDSCCDHLLQQYKDKISGHRPQAHRDLDDSNYPSDGALDPEYLDSLL